MLIAIAISGENKKKKANDKRNSQSDLPLNDANNNYAHIQEFLTENPLMPLDIPARVQHDATRKKRETFPRL